MEVLVIEDEAGIASLIRSCIEADGHSCTVATSGEEGLTLFQQHCPDAVILDVGLPDINGIEVCSRIRQLRQLKDAIIVMLTARRSELDRIVGYSSGADDYIEKPFSPQELPVRLRAVSRRFHQPTQAESSAPTPKLIQTNHLLIDPEQREVLLQHGDSPKLEFINLSSLEFDLLYLLASKPRRVWRRSDLLDAVMGQDFIGDERSIDSCIKRLRCKISPSGQRDRFIKTHFSIGYSFEDAKNA